MFSVSNDGTIITNDYGIKDYFWLKIMNREGTENKYPQTYHRSFGLTTFLVVPEKTAAN